METPRRPAASRFAQKEVDDPAATDMLTRLAAMAQDLGVVAPGCLKGGGQRGHPVENFGAIIVR